eukprot:TRINITY_DN18757_c1_g5_i1.p1 TRINITY_DN18757_c1_g5~~TRINITY_DN18757_c1_g5_i1.p1  ORF type:complete len:676 (-),score=182.28 TRINITY_DN18757_c1_g5_i1:192-2219(-)
MADQSYDLLGSIPIPVMVFALFHWLVDKLVSKHEKTIRKVLREHLFQCEPDSLLDKLLQLESITNNIVVLISPLIIVLLSFIGADFRIHADSQNGLRYSQMKDVFDPIVLKGIFIIYFNLFVVNTLTYALYVKKWIENFDISYYICTYLSEFWTHCGLLMIFYGVDIFEIVLAPISLYSFQCQAFMVGAIWLRIKLVNVMKSKMSRMLVYVLHSFLLLGEVYLCRLYGGAQTVLILEKPALEKGSPPFIFAQVIEGAIIIGSIIIFHTIFLLYPIAKQLWSLLKMKFEAVSYDKTHLMSGIFNKNPFDIKLKFLGPPDFHALIPIESFEVISVKKDGKTTKLLHVKAERPKVIRSNVNNDSLEIKVTVVPQDSLNGFAQQLSQVTDNECQLIAVANIKLNNDLYSYRISAWSAEQFKAYWMSITKQGLDMVSQRVIEGSHAIAKTLYDQAQCFAPKVKDAESKMIGFANTMSVLSNDIRNGCSSAHGFLTTVAGLANSCAADAPTALNRTGDNVPDFLKSVAPESVESFSNWVGGFGSTIRNVCSGIANIAETTKSGLETAAVCAQKVQNVANGAQVETGTEGTVSSITARASNAVAVAASEGLAPTQAIDIANNVNQYTGIVEGVGTVIKDSHMLEQVIETSSESLVDDEFEDADEDDELIEAAAPGDYSPEYR